MNDGGPAFPLPIQKVNFDTGPEHFRETETTGMSLRDYFAGMALQGFLSRKDLSYEQPLERIPKLAYEYADAMLKERDK